MSRSWPPRRRRRISAQRPRRWWRRLADYAITIVLLGVLAFMVSRLDRMNMRTEQGAATVHDGDTITLGSERIRLRGLDAPEYTQTCRKDGLDYACGKLARQALVRLIAGRPVSCSGGQRDRYGRLLGDCKAGDADLNRALVEGGWAVAYGDFEREEAAARSARRGIWAGSFERPRDWRRDHDGRDEKSAPPPDIITAVGDWLRQIFRFR